MEAIVSFNVPLSDGCGIESGRRLFAAGGCGCNAVPPGFLLGVDSGVMLP